MDKKERYRVIIDLLQKERKVSVNALAERFSTSQMTIRRDLNDLAGQYNIVRTHGGAMLDEDSLVRMISFDEKRILHKKEKNEIARKAAGMIRPGQRI